MSDAQLRHKIAGFLANKVKNFPGGKCGKGRFNLTNFVYRFLPLLGFDYSRGIEWKFIIENIPKGNRNLRILDIGSRLSLFVYKLLDYSDNIFAFDVDRFHEKLPRQIKFIIGNAMNAPLKKESVDIITLISVVEHFGLGYYEDPIEQSGDLKAMKEIRRALRTKGMLFFTTMVGRKYIISFNGNERIYDQKKFNQLIDNFSVVKEKYYIFRKRWIQVEKSRAFEENPKRSGLACIQLIKE